MLLLSQFYPPFPPTHPYILQPPSPATQHGPAFPTTLGLKMLEEKGNPPPPPLPRVW